MFDYEKLLYDSLLDNDCSNTLKHGLDVHVGSFFKQQVFDTVVEEVNKLNPDAIIITGDLTDEGLLFQYEYARTQIKKFTI